MNEHKLQTNTEKIILSNIIYKQELKAEYRESLKVESFYLIIHQAIFTAILELEAQEKPIDEEFILKEILSSIFKEKYFNYSNITQEQLEVALIEIIGTGEVPSISKYVKELQKKHIERETELLILKLKSKELDISKFKSKLLKIEDLYKRDSVIEDIKEDLKKDLLPNILVDIIGDIQKINNYPLPMVLSSVLSSLSGLVGARAKITNSTNIEVFPVVWSMIIAPSSVSAKSTLFKATKKAIFGNIQEDYYSRYELENEQYKENLKSFISLRKEEKLNTEEPVKPKVKVINFAPDSTPEAKIIALHNNQNGGITYFDEMKAELERTNNDIRYKALKTSLFDGETYHKELVKDNGTTYILRKPVISEIGLITEQWLIEAVQKNDVASGFLARYLFAYVERKDLKPLQITDYNFNYNKYAHISRNFMQILGEDREDPEIFVLTLEAKQYYKNWFNQLSLTAYETETDEELTATYRLTTYALKFTLLLYLIDNISQNINIIKLDKLAIGLEYLKGGIYLMELFQEQNSKVLDLFNKQDKLNFKIDDTFTKLKNKINKTKDKRISKTVAQQGIRGLKVGIIDKYAQENLISLTKIDRTTYISLL